jgi:hypothetical protein
MLFLFFFVSFCCALLHLSIACVLAPPQAIRRALQIVVSNVDRLIQHNTAMLLSSVQHTNSALSMK